MVDFEVCAVGRRGRVRILRKPLLFSRVVRGVSRGVERGVRAALKKRQMQRRPAKMRCFSSVSLNVVLEEMAQVRCCSEEKEET